jgi:hypothetical protein
MANTLAPYAIPYRQSMYQPVVAVRFATQKAMTAAIGAFDVVRAYRRLRNAGSRAAEALQLARARAEAENLGAEFLWDGDMDGCNGCECGSKDCPCSSGEPHDVEYARIVFAGETLASLGGICGATDDYRYLVGAELALEAIDALREHANDDADTAADY